MTTDRFIGRIIFENAAGSNDEILYGDVIPRGREIAGRGSII
jgi:hypothetical protein